MSALPPGWVACTLDDIKALAPYAIAGGPFGSDLVRADYVADGVPVIRGGNLGAGERRFYTDDLVFISEAKANQLARHPRRPAPRRHDPAHAFGARLEQRDRALGARSERLREHAEPRREPGH